MTMNANRMNASTNDAANAIRKVLPTFEAWYKTIDEYKSLEANAEGILDYNQISEEISSLEKNVFLKVLKGEKVEDLEDLKAKHNNLIEASEFIHRDARYIYDHIECLIDMIVGSVSEGNFEKALDHFNDLREYRPSGISNPIAGIDLNAIKAEIRSAQRECTILRAKNDAAHTAARSIAESCRDGFAVLGAVAAVAADLTLGVKVLKKILK